MPKSAEAWEHEIRAALRAGGSAAIARSVQRFFTEPVKSDGWRTADLRRFARDVRRRIEHESGGILVDVADRLFDGKEDTATGAAVLILQDHVEERSERDFRRFVRWLDRVTNWSQHDGLVHYLIAPMMVADSRRTALVRKWARARGRWHRRAAAVALVQASRRKLYFARTEEVTRLLLADEDDMVQKGLGWLLREWGKADPKRSMPLLLRIREQAPRLVLRTACEKLTAAERARVLETASRRPGVVK